MNDRLSKSQIDKLGERLKSEQASETDLQLLDDYRRSFGNAYDAIVRTLREQLGLEPTGRLAKTIPSIREKLRRESIRLSQIQDIAGCRVVVPDLAEQERVVDKLRDLFPHARVIDRRVTPSYGYRAVHIVPTHDEKHVEIQVRTSLQQRWAEISERYSDADPEIKYGGGNQEIAALLLQLSDTVYQHEQNRSEESHLGDELRRIKEQHSVLVKSIENAGQASEAANKKLSVINTAMVNAERTLLDTQNAFLASERGLAAFFDAFLAAIEGLKR